MKLKRNRFIDNPIEKGIVNYKDVEVEEGKYIGEIIMLTKSGKKLEFIEESTNFQTKTFLSWEDFLNEAYPGDRMKEKDDRYWKRKARPQRDSEIQSFINTIGHGDVFQYYTSGGTKICIFNSYRSNTLYYTEIPLIKDIAQFKIYKFDREKRIPLSRIGGIGRPSKDEIEDRIKEYELYVEKRTKPLDSNVSAFTRKVLSILEDTLKYSIRYK
jgi:hypothetical protein